MPAYIGVNGKAKAIAKVYKGNSEGKAEMIWGPKGIYKYAKSIEELSKAKDELAATTVGNYALFGGGFLKGTPCATVDVYDSSLTRTTATDLSEGRRTLAATTVGNYALFGGGYMPTKDESYSAAVDVYCAFE